MPNIQPSTYSLQSSDGTIKVDYEAFGFIGHPLLNLGEGTSSTVPIRHFSGSQIRAVSTEIGVLVTVTTEVTVDQGSTSLTILLPAIALEDFSGHETFETQAIVTSHSGPLSVPATGVDEKYQFIPLTGEASFSLALLGKLPQPVTGAAAQ